MGKVDIGGLIAIQLNRHVRIRVSDHVYAMIRSGAFVQVSDHVYRQAYAQIVRGI